MSKLNLGVNLTDHDDFYEMLVELHEGLTEEESSKVNARLILILMNQIGDRKIIAEAIECAK